MTKTRILAALILISTPILSFAASMIEARDGNGEVTRIYLDGDKARIEMPGNEGFAVLDVRNKTMQLVLHKQRAVLDMSSYMKGQNKGSSKSSGKYIDSYLKTRGLGPVIAGYDTEEQEIYADGQYCGSVFVSLRAMNELDLRRFASALDNIDEQIQQNVTGMTGMQMDQILDICTQAEKTLANQLMDIGFPLKSIDRQRRTESVVTQLLRNTQLPANAFVIPKNYKLTSPAKMMQDAMKQMQKQAPPNMQEMMNKLSPEAQEMIRQQMQQMQKYQQ